MYSDIGGGALFGVCAGAMDIVMIVIVARNKLRAIVRQANFCKV